MSKAGRFPCEWDNCNQTFNRKSDLGRHMSRQDHLDKRPYVCSYPSCRKKFAQRSGLTVHNRTHTGEKPFRCSHTGCEKEFSDSSSLARHRKICKGARQHECSPEQSPSSSRRNSVTDRRQKKASHREVQGSEASDDHSAQSELSMTHLQCDTNWPTRASSQQSYGMSHTPDAMAGGFDLSGNFQCDLNEPFAASNQSPQVSIVENHAGSIQPASIRNRQLSLYVTEDSNPGIATMHPDAVPRLYHGSTVRPQRPHLDMSFPERLRVSNQVTPAEASFHNAQAGVSFAEQSPATAVYRSQHASPVPQLHAMAGQYTYQMQQGMGQNHPQMPLPLGNATFVPSSRPVELQPWGVYQQPMVVQPLGTMPNMPPGFYSVFPDPKQSNDPYMLLPNGRLT